MLTVYGIKNCNKIRDTLKWFDEREADYQFVDLKKQPMSREELFELVSKVGLDVLVNRRGMKWRQLGLAGKEISDEELFDLLHEHQTMITRPLITKDEAVMVGYDENSFERFLD